MSDLYYSPEKFGLRVVDEVEFSSGAYEFDTSVLWQDIETGAFYVADDSGCSCPVPFEGVGRSDLLKIDRLQTLFEKRKSDSYYYEDNKSGIDAEVASLIGKYREAKR